MAHHHNSNFRSAEVWWWNDNNTTENIYISKYKITNYSFEAKECLEDYYLCLITYISELNKSYEMNLNIGTCIFQWVNNVFLNVSDKERRPEIQELMLDTAVL